MKLFVVVVFPLLVSAAQHEQEGIYLKFDPACVNNQAIIAEYCEGVRGFVSISRNLFKKGSMIGIIYEAENQRLFEQKELTNQQKEEVKKIFIDSRNFLTKKPKQKSELMKDYYVAYKSLLETDKIVYPENPIDNKDYHKAFLEANVNIKYTLKDRLLAVTFLWCATKTFEVMQ